jgi:hypothetical protein
LISIFKGTFGGIGLQQKKGEGFMLKKMLKNHKGFGVKEIAATLGFIVVVGLVITAMQGKLGGWLDDVWGFMKRFIENNIG